VYDANTIEVCWKGSTPPALSVGILFRRGLSTYLAQRVVFDPSSRGNNFTSVGGTTTNGCGQSNVYRQIITFNNPALGSNPPNPAVDILLALRIRPIYAAANIYIQPAAGEPLPSQGDLITSSGVTGTGVTRRIVVNRQYRSAPSVFDAAIVSQTNFSH
jgi:hypothetical protein